jgi:hypothetical protein
MLAAPEAPRLSLRCWLAAGVALALLAGCKHSSGLLDREAPPAARLNPVAGLGSASEWSQVPVPPADAPKLAPIVLSTSVRATPDPRADAIGYLRIGAQISRSAEPVRRDGCPDGWYAVRPLGFVCAGQEATLKLDHPLVRAIHVEPDRRAAMPYKYAFVRSIAPNYLRVPTKAEQFQYEMRLERHLRSYKRLRAKWDALDVGANDVPLDAQGVARGAIPEHAVPMDESVRFGGDGNDAVPWWLVGERRIPNISSFHAPPYAVIADRIKRHAGVALIGTFVADERAQNRRFAISADGRLVPADKLKADSGSPFHGTEIRTIGLPVAFGYDRDAHFYRYEGGKLEPDAELGWREFVPLSGAVKLLAGSRMVETRDHRWVKSDQVRTVARPSNLPSWARGRTKWIEVSIFSQSMTLWEGDTPVYVTLVSTGRDGVGDPKKTLSTPQGMFRIYQKHITTTMDSAVADHEFELRDVPWVMYFSAGYALHAAYWHDDFGKGRSHGCVNLAPIDARFAFMWSAPDVPEHWHAAYSGDAFGQGTLVYVHA